MDNKLSLNAQRIFLLCFSICFTCLTILLWMHNIEQDTVLTKFLHSWAKIGTAVLGFLFGFGYNLIAKQYYAEQNIRIKWRVVTLGLKKVDWNKYDFHLTPVLTFTRVFHPTGLANSRSLALEWGHWAISIGRFKFLKQQ